MTPEQMARKVIEHGGHYDIAGDETVALAQAYLTLWTTRAEQAEATTRRLGDALILATYRATEAEADNRRLREALEAARGLVEEAEMHAFDTAIGHYVVGQAWLDAAKIALAATPEGQS